MTVKISVGKRAPIPGFPYPVPGGRVEVLKNNRGIFGDGDRFSNGFFGGCIPENPRKFFWDILGTGKILIFGNSGVSSPTNP